MSLYLALIHEAIACIDRGGCGIALVVDAENRLIRTVTDGDARRAMLAGLDLETPISTLLASKADTQYPKPVIAHLGTRHDELLALMRHNVLHQIPILDDDGRVVDLVMLDDLIPI